MLWTVEMTEIEVLRMNCNSLLDAPRECGSECAGVSVVPRTADVTLVQQEHRTGHLSRSRVGRGKAYRHQDGYAADDAQTRALAFFQSTFGAVILHSVNVPFQRVQAEGDDEHAEALLQKAAAQTGRRICWSWRGAIAPPANAE